MDTLADYWKKTWNAQADAENMFVQMGRSSYTPLEFFIMMNDVTKALKFDNGDVVLDAGGGAGWTSIYLSPFVKEIDLFDYAEKMVEKAKEVTSHFTNIEVFHDDLLAMENVIHKQYRKIIVGSVLQYLNSYEQVEAALFNVYSVMESHSVALFAHNPDIRKKDAHIKSYERLGWDQERIQKSLEIEEKRLWLDISRIKEIASEVGFSSCYETPINQKLWQSTHMFDFVVEK